MAFLGANFTRQVGEDNANFRYYELAGATHNTVHTDIEIIPAFVFDFPILLEDLCLNEMNTLADGPVFGKYLYNAMWKNLERRVQDGVPMPTGDPLELNLFLQIVRDADGNAQGGVRLPAMNAPIASYDPPQNFGKPACTFPPFPPSCDPTGFAPLVCFLSGSVFPFDQTTLDGRYSSHSDYVDQVTSDADRLAAEGFLLNRDRLELIQRAAGAAIP